MWLSLSWLSDFVDLGDRSPESIARDLTMRTALIEGIERRGEFSAAVVVGKVLERAPHPDADRLSRCVVDVGDESIELVCGAPNVAAGQTVAVAKVGAVLSGDIRIRKSKIRGVVSHGMICSERELGLGGDQEGIIVLEDGLEVGRPFREVPGVADVVLEIDNKSITHRPDLWGHQGFGRELAAIYGLELKPARLDESLVAGSGPVAVEIEASDLCGRYHGLFLRGRLGEASPGWLRRRLVHCGLRPLSLAVDVSNYVMLELGQPTHPFDLARLAGGVIRVRRAAPGETLVTLDGERRRLPENACMIADGERAIAIGGIIGGLDSGIDSGTSAAVLESASFDAVSVRTTSTALGLRTDALARFEKALDPALAERGMRRYAALLREIAPEVQIAHEFVVAGHGEQPPVTVRLRPARASMKLGIRLERHDIETGLTALGFGLVPAGDDYLVTVPPFRATRDVRNEDDLIEEVGRIQGYERIPEELPRVSCRPVELEPVNVAWRTCVRLLSGRLGFAEVTSYPYVEDGILERCGGGAVGEYLEILNPLQQTARRLRRSQIPGLVEFVDRNIKAVEVVKLFECGRVYLVREERSALPYEAQVLSAAWGERVLRKGPDGRRQEVQVVRHLKGVLEEVGEALERPLRLEAVSGPAPAWLHPVRSAAVLAGDVALGHLGQVHPEIASGLGWKGEVALFEIDLTRTIETPARPRRYQALARYPAVRVDVSFVAPFSLRYDVVCGGLREVASLLTGIELIDEYTSGSLAEGQRSLTLGLSFRAADRTLSDEDVSTQIRQVHSWLGGHGAKVRGEGA